MIKETSKMPDFLVIGAGKSGTTSLHEYLNQHPQIFMGEKEPNFFAYVKTDPQTIEDPIDKQHYYNSVTTLKEYQKLFEAAKPGQIIGEVSNTYISKNGAYENIREQLPNVKLVAILRHPAERLYSRFTHLQREGSPLASSTEVFFDKTSEWWRRSDLVYEGLYYERLKPIFENFPHEHIKVYLYEDFIHKTDEVMEDLFNYLGVDSSVKVGTNVVYNKSGTIKNKQLNSLVGQNSAPILFLKKHLPFVHKMLKGNTKVNAWLSNIRRKNLTKPGMDSALRQRLLDEVYGQDIQKLSGLLKKDLSHWL